METALCVGSAAQLCVFELKQGQLLISLRTDEKKKEEEEEIT